MLICSANYPVTTTAANHIYINYKPSLLNCKLGYFYLEVEIFYYVVITFSKII